MRTNIAIYLGFALSSHLGGAKGDSGMQSERVLAQPYETAIRAAQRGLLDANATKESTPRRKDSRQACERGSPEQCSPVAPGTSETEEALSIIKLGGRHGFRPW